MDAGREWHPVSPALVGPEFEAQARVSDPREPRSGVGTRPAVEPESIVKTYTAPTQTPSILVGCELGSQAIDSLVLLPRLERGTY